MPIISISINENLLKEMDSLIERGFSGRSEVVRAGIRKVAAEEKQLSQINGIVEGIIVIANEKQKNEQISKIRHEHDDIIKTEIHSHLESDKCMQIFVVNGNAYKFKQFINELRKCKAEVRYILA